VANPSQWSWHTLFTEKTVDYKFGRLQRNYPNVQAGDLVVGYESTPSKRIVALASVTGEYDAQEAPYITLEPITPVDNGLTYDELRADPVLAESEPMKFRCQGTLLRCHLSRRPSARRPRRARSARRIRRCAERSAAHQHHLPPSYAYEDFIEGFRPKQTAEDKMALVLVDGVFKRVCDAARAHPHMRYVVLIDRDQPRQHPQDLR